MAAHDPYPPIGDYALIGDCHSAALVSRDASIDWCCMPRFDSGSCFGRLLDWKRGGYCAIAPVHGGHTSFRRYLDNTLVLETTIRTSAGEARIIDCFTMRAGGKHDPFHQVLRVVEGVRGRVDLKLEVAPRFDYGDVRPWIRHEGKHLYSAVGGNDGLLIWSDTPLTLVGRHDLAATFTVRAGERVRLSLSFVRPEQLDSERPLPFDPRELDRRLDATKAWWERWAGQARLDGPDGPGAIRSAITLRALMNAPTGAIIAAPTTSLPESLDGPRNWDYRYSWVRDSCFSVRSLADVGCAGEADQFRRFIERSAAGSTESLQIMYGVGGERRLPEIIIEELEGYRGLKPVRIGNAASRQAQLDVYGWLLDLSWRWYVRGQSPDDDYWRFLVDLVDTAAERWQEADRGIWEVRGDPRHFVHSKVMCWTAIDRGLRLAEACQRRAPVRRWRKARRDIRAAVETEGYDKSRGVFVQSFGSKEVDAALLLLPSVEFVDYSDERMVRTVEAIREDLSQDGLLLRYRVTQTNDGLSGSEGVFLACTYWLAECLARQGNVEEARHVFDRVATTGNDLGLFAEEYLPSQRLLLGNFPQGLTHLSQIAAAVAIAERQGYDMATSDV